MQTFQAFLRFLVVALLAAFAVSSTAFPVPRRALIGVSVRPMKMATHMTAAAMAPMAAVNGNAPTTAPAAEKAPSLPAMVQESQ